MDRLVEEGWLTVADGQRVKYGIDERRSRWNEIGGYPLGFFAKGMDGHIDDPNAGWKGKGIWTTWGTRTTFHAEGGTDNVAKIVKFQLRPDPTAK